MAAANNLQNKAIILALALSIPATVGLFILASPIIHLIYERGVFTHKDTVNTAGALAAFSLGLPAFVIAKVLSPIFYANGDTKTPMRITTYTLIANSFLNIVLSFPFSHVGIAIGSSIAAWYNIWLLNKYAKNYGNFKIVKKTKEYIYKMLISASIMALILVILNYFNHNLYYSSSFIVKVLALSLSIGIAAITYLLMLYLFKIHLIFIRKQDNQSL